MMIWSNLKQAMLYLARGGESASISSEISQFIRDDDICGQLLTRIKSSDPHGDNAEDGSGVLSNAVWGSAESHDNQNLHWSAEEAQQGQLGSVSVVSLHRMVIASISGGVMAEIRVGEAWELGKTQADPGEMPAGPRTGVGILVVQNIYKVDNNTALLRVYWLGRVSILELTGCYSYQIRSAARFPVLIFAHRLRRRVHVIQHVECIFY